MKRRKKAGTRIISFLTAAGLLLTPYSVSMPVHANTNFRGELTSVDSVTVDGSNKNIVNVSFNSGAVTAKITFLEGNIFRYNVDPTGTFSEYATPRSTDHVARIQQYPDDSDEYTHPEATVSDTNGEFVISSGTTKIKFNKATAVMSVLNNDTVVMQEQDGLIINDNTTVQTLVKNEGEQFFGGGTQNGRFIHTGKTISIVNTNRWNDGDVSSPNPFYYTTKGYGVLRNTFMQGSYDFGSTNAGSVRTVHNESEFDAYYFVSDGTNGTEVVQDVLQGYFKVTGNPVLLPEYGFYEGHLNCYNRDSWTTTSGERGEWIWKGSAPSTAVAGEEGVITKKETGMSTNYRLSDGLMAESLNGELPTVHVDMFPSVTAPEEYSARALIDDYETYDMPFGYFLPNDGYGCGYGKNGYRKTGGVDAQGKSSADRLAAIAANVENLKSFTEYAQSKGVETGLWTQSTLVPDSNSNTEWHLLRDFEQEVRTGGITTLKTDVAWVGPGYSFGLNGVKFAYDIVTTIKNYRPNIISVDGWAGTQRFASIWTGDQYGGNWEYIRFHIPTYIGQSLSGNPNVNSDMDGIFGGDSLIATRDTQWKAFTTQMMNMDGWGSAAKTPFTFGDPYTGISRMYLKLKARLMPYIYTTAASAANIDTKNGDTGLPMVRAMFLEYPNEPQVYNVAATQYQYMFGESLLVAPIYTETAKKDTDGNDVRNGIYLPDDSAVWVDYFTGEQYRGGQTLNNFDAPLWKLPVFVKNGSIIPMYNENNNPTEIDRTQRFVEFWPSGTSSYTVFEDDGKYVENKITEDAEYGKISEISYGEHVSTEYTSVVENGTAVLTANTSTGNYDGYNSNKKTTFIVNVSKEPTSTVAKNGATELTIQEVDSKAVFDETEATDNQAIYFYDATPEIETYAPAKETQVKALVENVEVSPKLYVKFATTDSKTTAQTLTLEGFENDGNLPVNTQNNNLTAPTDLAAPEEDKTPNSIKLTWSPVADATSYEVMADDMLYSVGDATEFEHVDLEYNSTHTYKVRARNDDGYSAWTDEITTTSKDDPWRNVPDMEISFAGGDQWGPLANATDHDFTNMFHSTVDTVVTEEIPVIIDLGTGYELDKFEYYPRGDNYGNGLVTKMDVYTSLDGLHWKIQQNGLENVWTYDRNLTVQENVQTVNFNGEGARYVKLVAKDSTGGFFSASELVVYKEDGSTSFAVGSTNGNTTVLEGDYSNMRNYLGTSTKDGAHFVDQIQARHGDINYNDVYDVYDYAFTMFKLDGGTTKTGSVSGNIFLIPSAETVSAGETFEISVYADSVTNLNAFGHVINFDPSKVDFVSVTPIGAIAGMEDMNVKKIYEDGTAYYNLAYANKGDKPLIIGTGVLATITVEAKQDISTNDTNTIDLRYVDLIGPNFSLIKTDASQTTAPSLNTQLIPSDRISAEGQYSESNTADKAFDNDLATFWESPYGTGASLPVDFVITLGSTYMLEKLDMISHTAKNGGITEYEIFVSEDGNNWTSVKTGTRAAADYLQNGNVMISNRFDDAVRAKYIKITIKGSVGRLEEENNKYARIAEIKLFGTEAGGQVPDTVNKSQLQALVDANAGKTQGSYTDESWATFTEALQRAQNVLADASATQTAVDAAKADLESAVNGLTEKGPDGPDNPDKPVTPDTADLQKLVDANKDKKQGNYTDESWKTFTDALKEAQNVLANTSATQSAVDAAKAALDSAIKGLKEKAPDDKPVAPDKSDLQKLVDANKGKAQGSYTDESWKDFTDALKSAQSVLASASATQADVDLAEVTLQDAVSGLKEKTDTPPAEKPWIFTDVDVNPGAWKYESVKYVYNNDIMGAITGTTEFQPDRPLSRSMFATVLYRMADSPAVTYADTFSDVPAGKWYSDAIIWANQKGIVQGLSDGSFGIDNNITREQIAKMLFEYADKVCGFNVSDKKDLAQFTDADAVSGWAVGYMQWATAVEMITGKPNDAAQTSFRMDPKGEATRAECAAMLMRFENKYVNQ